ncbi:MAG: M14 family zinc carboxypeptidase, partial [Candidatus Cloacimonadaceae bacterium]|nr:M14 family zinc carboxypeptidase [Candidatus Cloacimonadaceae bacterium]
YPTYDAYVTMMYAFASSYPNLCQIIDAGTTVAGRKILYARISDNVHLHEAEPEVAYVSTIHGDETTGYILMLRLIDTLLSSYGSDPRITNLVNNLDIYINPNANPDGTYYGGNSSVSGARRANANGYDLNRNFPSPTGSQYTNQPLQTETSLAMTFANNRRIALSANFHGGAEVVNYPWDHTYALHPDNNWWVSTSLLYANSVQTNGPAGYFTSVSANGISNGAAWYVITGGRQDWMGYTAKGREVTLEISNTKNPAASTLPNYWNYNYDAMLSYLEQALYGVHGTVTDPYGNPLNATITVVGLDNSYSVIRSDPSHGDFYRYLSPGTYSLLVEAAGFPSETLNNVVVTANQKTTLNVVLGELPHVQQIVMNSGWNLVGLNVVPASYSVSDVLAGISPLRQLKTNAKSYSPQMAPWFNSLVNIEPGKGYWIHLDAPATLQIQGPLITTGSTPISLNPGWNLVSYLPESPQTVETALNSIITHLLEVRYLDQSWIPGAGNLPQMEPGKAYWVNVSQACTLLYP